MGISQPLYCLSFVKNKLVSSVISLLLILVIKSEPDNSADFLGVFNSSRDTLVGLLGDYNDYQPTHRTKNQCPPTCVADWIGDGWCDSECAISECQNDGGDCKGWCSPDCKPTWIGDGYCDLDCFRAECHYDAGDCDKKYNRRELTNALFPPRGGFDYSKCPESCDRSLLNNTVCDDSCNIMECAFDGGDCRHACHSGCRTAWLGDGECDFSCNVESCHFDKGDCPICSPGCDPGMIGNGICDDACNNEKCRLDMGDCEGVCWSPEKLNYKSEFFFYPHCRTEWKGDGFCDCFCMTPQCDFDFEDCKNENCTWAYTILQAHFEQLNITNPKTPYPGSA